MCGIAGIVTGSGDGSLSHQLDQMVRVQAHRGPDDEGSWFGSVGSTQVALGHGRLAILDLTEAGHQPMVSECGRHVLVYNGELYNYKELRQVLQGVGVPFYTECDTEIVLKSLMTWGKEALPRFNGMWAFAWLDLHRGKLLLSRDRFGIKPLYFYQAKGNGAFFFASEIKSILAGSGERFEVNATTVARYLQQSLLDAQKETFFAGIEALPAGHTLCFDLKDFDGSVPPALSYWTVARDDGHGGSISQRIEEVEQTFIDAVRVRLRSDVPVGVLLSGGIDSSAIAAAMSQPEGHIGDLHVMSGISDDPRYDEQPFIDRMTTHLDCHVHKVPLAFAPEEAFELLNTITWFNDEPVGSFSNVAHYLLMQEAKRLGVTVILSGQGADELLCGYLKYLGFYLQSLIKRGKWPAALKVLAGFARRGTVIPQFRIQEAKRYIPSYLRPKEIDIRGPLLRAEDFRVDVGLGGKSVRDRQSTDLYQLSVPALCHSEDRMSMAFAREIRLPFLDHRLVDLLLPLSPEWKLRDGWTKWVFRKAMETHLPQEIVMRKDKQGFVNPQSEWLKNELRGEVEDIIHGELLVSKFGLVDQEALQRRYRAYLRQPSGRGTISFKNILQPIALELWSRQFEGSLRSA